MSYHSRFTRISLRCLDVDWDDAMQIAGDTRQSLIDVLEAALTVGIAQLQRQNEAEKVRRELSSGDPVRAMMAQLVVNISPREAARALAYHRHHPRD